MNFDEFLDAVAKGVKEVLGNKMQTQIRTVLKNNGVRLHGLIILSKETTMSPTIYLEGFYEDYREGKTLGDIVYEVVHIYEHSKITTDVDISFFINYESVKERIFLKIIHYENNKEKLGNQPYIRFQDLAVVCYYAYMNDFFGKGTIQIETDHLDRWGISEEELFAKARENTKEKLGMLLLGMEEILTELLEETTEEPDREQIENMLDDMDNRIPMTIMTVGGRCFGAVCIYYREMMECFGRKCGKNFYILPSSVHEVILVPDSGREIPRELRQMVQDVNAEHVSVEERLSNEIYYYDMSKHSLKMVV